MMSLPKPGDPEEAGPGQPATGLDPGDPSAEPEGGRPRPLGPATLAVPYLPDFPLEEIQFWFAPDRSKPQAIYHQLLGRSHDKWDIYYNKKGWRFVHLDPEERQAEGPFRAAPGELRLEILEPGRFFAPRPFLRLGPERAEVAIVSIEKRRPLNQWKPTYIKALNFIKKYEWLKPVAGVVEMAFYEIEECGEVAGSTSWRNAEMILEDHMSADLRATLVDLFEKRPEEFPLGSEVYLKILGRSGEEGFRMLCDLHRLPQVRKRKHVARALGKLGKPEAAPTLFVLLDDEDPEVRLAALRALGRVGVRGEDPGAPRMREMLESEVVATRVWAAQALIRGGDESPKKLLITLVKEREELPLSDMGELGEVLAELGVVEVVPYLIARLKSEKSEIRADAAEALRAVTGLEIEFSPGDEEGRRQAIRACTRWWEDSKKERRRTAAGKE
jgi:hypothetical protein